MGKLKNMIHSCAPPSHAALHTVILLCSLMIHGVSLVRIGSRSLSGTQNKHPSTHAISPCISHGSGAWLLLLSRETTQMVVRT